MKITLVTVGKIKERFFEDAIAEYSKRLGRYCKLEIIQVADEKTPDGAGENVERQIREKEGQRILAQIKDGAYVLALAIEGKMLSSEELAEMCIRDSPVQLCTFLLLPVNKSCVKTPFKDTCMIGCVCRNRHVRLFKPDAFVKIITAHLCSFSHII